MVINEAENQSGLVTRGDLKEFRNEILFEMKSFEKRITNKIGAIIVSAAAAMMFLDEFPK